MDDADTTDRSMEMINKANLSNSHRWVPAAAVPTGECLFCGEVVMPPRRWCNSLCRDDWEKDYAA